MEKALGFILLAVVLILGKVFLKDTLFFRLLIGLGFGYTLNRAYMGFAGSVARLYRTGSTQLMRTLMMLFFLTSTMMAGLLMGHSAETYNLWVNPINVGLILGGLLFGGGMVLSSCCATGVLTDLASAVPRAGITLIFFGIGIFVGFPIQKTASWVKQSWFVSAEGTNGVFLPDLFKGGALGGYLGAILLTGLFCAIVIFVSYLYEKKRKAERTFTGVASEVEQMQHVEIDTASFSPTSKSSYDFFFANPWSLKMGIVILAALFIILTAVSKSGWGASTPYGLWVGKFLMLFGVSADSLAGFTHVPAKVFNIPFFGHPVYIQNIGIFLGALIYLMTAGRLSSTAKEASKITGGQALLYILGGFLMGFGTRLSNGCNVGALYTPIANFSLSGWIFFIFMVIGGVLSLTILRAKPKAQ